MRLAIPCALLGFVLVLGCNIPRDPRPERTPSPTPSAEYPLQTWRQPALSTTGALSLIFPGWLEAQPRYCQGDQQ